MINTTPDEQLRWLIWSTKTNFDYSDLLKLLITRAHSFPRPVEFCAEPRNLGFFRRFEPRNLTAEFVFLPWNSAEFDVFHSNNNFFTENDLKVALLQVCL